MFVFKTVKRCLRYIYLFIYFLFIYDTLSSNFRSIDCRVVAYGRVNTNENFKHLALKVVAGAHERCFLTRMFQIQCFESEPLSIWENWSLRRGGRLRDVAATRGSIVCANTLGEDHEIYHYDGATSMK